MGSEKTYKRKVRNFLIDKRFQLKYTFSVMLLSSLLSSGLGYVLYQAHQRLYGAHQELYLANEEVYQAQRENSKLISLDPDLDAALAEELKRKDDKIIQKQSQLKQQNQEIQKEGRHVLFFLALFLGALVLCSGGISIVATHKIAGPAYALSRMLGDVAAGKLSQIRGLRKGDELQAVGNQLHSMIDSLREKEQIELELVKEIKRIAEDPEELRKKIVDISNELIQQKQLKLGHQ